MQIRNVIVYTFFFLNKVQDIVHNSQEIVFGNYYYALQHSNLEWSIIRNVQ